MRKTVCRVAAATGVLMAGAALPLVVTAPAQAAPQHCVAYLKNHYTVGPKVRAACNAAGRGDGAEGIRLCENMLHVIGVSEYHAKSGCNLSDH